MTLRGHSPIEASKLRQLARLVQLHIETHPARIAQRFGVSVAYVRQMWRTFSTDEMADDLDSLRELRCANFPKSLSLDPHQAFASGIASLEARRAAGREDPEGETCGCEAVKFTGAPQGSQFRDQRTQVESGLRPIRITARGRST